MSKTATYSLIASATPTGTTTVTFSSIPGTYTDLILILSTLSASGGNTHIRFNGDSTSLYSETRFFGNGTTATAGRDGPTSLHYVAEGNANSTTPSIGIVHIMDYANTTTFKSSVGRGGNPSSQVNAKTYLYRSTNAITSIVLTQDTANYTSGTTMKLYGIQAGNA
jgi:hypothetical protein